MAIKLESAQAGVDPFHFDRREAGARQDRWMSELEKASLFAAPEKPAHGGRPHASLPQSGAPAHVTGAARQTGAADRHASVQAAARAGAPGAARAHGAVVAAAHGAPQVIAAPQAAWRAAPAALRSTIGEGAGGEALHVSSLANAALVRMALQMAPAADSAAPESPDAPDHGGVSGGDEAPQFAERAMHVQLADDGVHAWIRDAALQGGQLSAVMQALAAEVALNGKPLATLTVNGMPVPLRASALPADSFIAAGDGAEAPSVSNEFSQPVIKGNPAP